MNCWCNPSDGRRHSFNKCQRCQAAADKKNLNLQIALLEDSLTFLEEIVNAKILNLPKSLWYPKEHEEYRGWKDGRHFNGSTHHYE